MLRLYVFLNLIKKSSNMISFFAFIKLIYLNIELLNSSIVQNLDFYAAISQDKHYLILANVLLIFAFFTPLLSEVLLVFIKENVKLIKIKENFSPKEFNLHINKATAKVGLIISYLLIVFYCIFLNNYWVIYLTIAIIFLIFFYKNFFHISKKKYRNLFIYIILSIIYLLFISNVFFIQQLDLVHIIILFILLRIFLLHFRDILLNFDL